MTKRTQIFDWNPETANYPCVHLTDIDENGTVEFSLITNTKQLDLYLDAREAGILGLALIAAANARP